MKTLSLSCNACGGGLQPPSDARFITCSFCGTRLQIFHEGNAYFSRAMEAIAQNTEKMSGDLDTIKIQNEIERLDREWGLEREKYLIRNKDGSLSEPGGSVVTVLFLILWLAVGIFMTIGFMAAPVTGIWLFPAGLTTIGTIAIVSSFGSNEKYKLAQQDYQRKRAALLDRLPNDLVAK